MTLWSVSIIGQVSVFQADGRVAAEFTITGWYGDLLKLLSGKPVKYGDIFLNV